MKSSLDAAMTEALLAKRNASTSEEIVQSSRPAGRREKRLYCVVDEDVARQLKIFSIQTDMSINRILKDALSTYLTTHGADFRL